MSKRQIWLRDDERELVHSCLRFVQEQLNTGTVFSDAHKMAGRYTYRRISDLLPLFAPTPVIEKPKEPQ